MNKVLGLISTLIITGGLYILCFNIPLTHYQALKKQRDAYGDSAYRVTSLSLKTTDIKIRDWADSMYWEYRNQEKHFDHLIDSIDGREMEKRFPQLKTQ